MRSKPPPLLFKLAFRSERLSEKRGRSGTCPLQSAAAMLHGRLLCLLLFKLGYHVIYRRVLRAESIKKSIINYFLIQEFTFPSTKLEIGIRRRRTAHRQLPKFRSKSHVSASLQENMSARLRIHLLCLRSASQYSWPNIPREFGLLASPSFFSTV